MSKFIEITPTEIEGNVFQMIGKDWMLITAGNTDGFNTMTASWGGMGYMWNVPVTATVVRPTRYTYEFTEREEYYSLTFFGEEYRKALSLCGTVSGRDTDKVSDAGLTPVFSAEAPYFDEAKLVLICRKMYHSDLNPERFENPETDKFYEKKDYHRMYVGEVVKVLKKAD